MAAGMLEAGLDVTTADLTIGTSAGATAAAQLAGATPPELLAGALATTSAHQPRPGSRDSAARGAVADHLDRFRALIASSTDAADMRRRMGAAALERVAASDGPWQSRWRATVAARLPGALWPDRAVVLTAVDARTGEPVVFDRHSGVELIDAVAASTAGGGYAYEIGGRHYIDGGYRSNADNADLATGFARVLVLSPLGGRSLYPAEWGTRLAAQVKQLRAGGSRVVTIAPGAASEHLFGTAAMDVSLRPAAARAGYEEGMAQAAEIADAWA